MREIPLQDGATAPGAWLVHTRSRDAIRSSPRASMGRFFDVKVNWRLIRQPTGGGGGQNHKSRGAPVQLLDKMQKKAFLAG